MGLISQLDQLISNSASDDCSVTVIYSGVTITDFTDILLNCGCPISPLRPRCSVLIAFLGTLASATFDVMALHFSCLLFCYMHVCLHGSTPKHGSTASSDQQASPLLPMHRSQCSLSEPDQHLLQPVMLPLCIKASMSVNVSVSNYLNASVCTYT